MSAPLHSLDGILTAFSPSTEHFALVTPDGRIRVFDTGSGRLVVQLSDTSKANGHLTDSLTSLTWVIPKEKKKSVQFTGLAGGTASGDVLLFDVKLGELKWRASNCIEGGVQSLCFSSSSGALLVTGKSCEIISLDVAKGKVLSRSQASKYPLTCIQTLQDASHVLCGASSMQLWDMGKQERVAKYTGHATEVRALAVAPGGCGYAASAASSERQVSLWQVPPSRKSKKQHAAAASLILDEPAVQLDTAACSPGQGEQDGSTSAFLVAAVSEAGQAYVWRCQRGGSSAEGEGAGIDGRLLLHVRVGQAGSQTSAAGGEEVILAARLQGGGAAGHSLLIARGSTAKPVFETLALPDGSMDTDGPTTLSLTPSGGALLANGTSTSGSTPVDKSIASQRKATRAPADVAVLGPENLGQAVLVRGAVASSAPGAGEAAGTSSRRKRPAEAEDDAEKPSAAGKAAASGQKADKAAASGSADKQRGDKKVQDGDTDPDALVKEDIEEEELLSERVAALELRTLGGQGARHEEAGTSGASTADDKLPAGSGKADSLSVLLTQAVRSNDSALLERCLANSTNNVLVTNTIARIVPTDAAAFLKAAVERLLSTPARASQLVPWVRAVLLHHTGYLMTAPGVQPTLTALFQAIDNRVKLYEPMLRVHGRLSLVLHHAKPEQSAAARHEGAVMPGPETVFVDELFEEEPEAEDPFAPGAFSDDEEDGSGEDESEDGDDSDVDGDGNEFDAMLVTGANGEGDDDDEVSSDLADLM